MIMRAVDPRYFSTHLNSSLNQLVELRTTPDGLNFIRNSAAIFARRLVTSQEALMKLVGEAKERRQMPIESITVFLANGGSWDEVLLLCVKYSGHDEIARWALKQNADPFIVDPQTELGLTEMTETCPWGSAVHRMIVQAQATRLASDPRILSFMMAVCNGETISSIPYEMRNPSREILEQYRLTAINERRKSLLR